MPRTGFEAYVHLQPVLHKGLPRVILEIYLQLQRAYLQLRVRDLRAEVERPSQNRQGRCETIRNPANPFE
jgi:hypothetical protein